MVGVVLYKNFETGSYENITITCFDGESYADLERQNEFSSYTVSVSGHSIRKTTSTSEAAPSPAITDIKEVYNKAREFFCDNSHCTVAEFVKTQTDVFFRFRSGKCGVYAPVDIRNIHCHPGDNVYALCADIKESTPLYLSLVCDILNFCMDMLFDAEDEVYGFSGNGVYLNTSLFLQKYPDVPSFPGNNPRKKRHKINLKRMKEKSFVREEQTSSLTGHRIVNRYCFLRKKALDMVLENLCGLKTLSDIQKYLFALPDLDCIRNLSEDFMEEIAEALGIYTYAFDAKSHIYYIGIKEALRLITCGEDYDDKLSQRASVQSANMKLRSKLPNPDYYTSCGKAIWK